MPLLGSVLIIDDEKEIREFLRDCLEQISLFSSIVLAEDGSEAHRKLANQKFSLVIIDNRLPKNTGVDVISTVLKNKSHLNFKTPFILFSGQFDKGDVLTARNVGVKFFLTKPIDKTKLLESIKQALTSAKAAAKKSA